MLKVFLHSSCLQLLDVWAKIAISRFKLGTPIDFVTSAVPVAGTSLALFVRRFLWHNGRKLHSQSGNLDCALLSSILPHVLGRATAQEEGRDCCVPGLDMASLQQFLAASVATPEAKFDSLLREMSARFVPVSETVVQHLPSCLSVHKPGVWSILTLMITMGRRVLDLCALLPWTWRMHALYMLPLLTHVHFPLPSVFTFRRTF